jgi:hypothetical protein
MCATEETILYLPKISDAVAECEQCKRERYGVLYWECERCRGVKIPLALYE